MRNLIRKLLKSFNDFTDGGGCHNSDKGGVNAVFKKVLKIPQSHKTTKWCAA